MPNDGVTCCRISQTCLEPIYQWREEVRDSSHGVMDSSSRRSSLVIGLSSMRYNVCRCQFLPSVRACLCMLCIAAEPGVAVSTGGAECLLRSPSRSLCTRAGQDVPHPARSGQDIRVSESTKAGRWTERASSLVPQPIHSGMSSLPRFISGWQPTRPESCYCYLRVPRSMWMR